MTRIFLNASMEARKGVMKLKLVRAFIAFVVVSLFVGISSAFNGQDYAEKNEKESTNYVEKVEIDNTSDDISTEIVDKNISEQVEEKKQTNNSFSESKEKIESKKQEVKKTETNTNQSTTKIETIKPSNQPVEVKTETNQTNSQEELKESSPANNSNNDDKINSTYYSITKGNPEYPTESACKSAGLKIQNKELDAILDWNEEHPDNPKTRVIGSSMCIIVMKDGKEHWYLHFLTLSGENLDDELKKLYK